MSFSKVKTIFLSTLHQLKIVLCYIDILFFILLQNGVLKCIVLLCTEQIARHVI